ncbi:hypothetical protein MTO96_045849 [Rhipicephalus appendiculatus]
MLSEALHLHRRRYTSSNHLGRMAPFKANTRCEIFQRVSFIQNNAKPPAAEPLRFVMADGYTPAGIREASVSHHTRQHVTGCGIANRAVASLH